MKVGEDSVLAIQSDRSQGKARVRPGRRESVPKGARGRGGGRGRERHAQAKEKHRDMTRDGGGKSRHVR